MVRATLLACNLFASAVSIFFAAPSRSADLPQHSEFSAFAGAAPSIVHADIVALDQIIVYNRFGSFDPYGMIFALQRDVSAATDLGDTEVGGRCALKTGTEPGKGSLEAGRVRLKDCKRPRPLVLRARVGDILRINLTNLLRPEQPGISQTFCEAGASDGNLPNIGDIRANVTNYPTTRDGKPLCNSAPVFGDSIAKTGVENDGKAIDFPRTRGLSFVIPGIEPVVGPKDNGHIPPECKGLAAIRPGQSMTCHFRLDREGTHLFQSMAAATGGEGDGGSLTHGLFGALIVEPAQSTFYRSQLPMAAFDEVWTAAEHGPGVEVAPHSRIGTPTYSALSKQPEEPQAKLAIEAQNKNHEANPCDKVGSVPVAALLRECGVSETFSLDGESDEYKVAEIVHGDINAIVVPPAIHAGTVEDPYGKPSAKPFREFVVIFHDELKTFYTKEMESLDDFDQFSGIRDGFGINYGASGAGAIVLANKLKIGPAANCPECAYEEFFLGSWANGDPALLENFVDDPSNVHHSYLNDRIVFRNFHAGPKETHVFHLHSHQWFAGNDKNRGAYLDSQTIGPQQGMTYDIYGGGTELYHPGALIDGKLQKGWFETLGSGNRNRTPGDAIFHCHLYPHFAQGMWELWRVHDVLEDGTRTLPDGQPEAGLSLEPRTVDLTAPPRMGTPTSGDGPALWTIKPGDPKRAVAYMEEGTPIPGLLPVPRQAAPLLPTYDTKETKTGDLKGFPGFPFYIAGEVGHRAPQPPMDIAVKDDKRLDGGLGRHVVTQGTRIRDVATDLVNMLKKDVESKSIGISLTTIEQEQLAKAKQAAEEAEVTLVNGIPYFEGKIVPVTVAQMLALGDLTESYHKLSIRLLPPDGTTLERNAMAFHHQGLREGIAGDKLLLRNANGVELTSVPGDTVLPLHSIPSTPGDSASENDKEKNTKALEKFVAALGYKSIYVPFGSTDSSSADAKDRKPDVFAVNGAAPRPGAPFADPCGAPDSLRGTAISDPSAFKGSPASYPYFTTRPVLYRSQLVGGPNKFNDTLGYYPPESMTYDPALSGFRRFEASVVQFDMIVNKAGWHDPQARINVLTAKSGDYKPGGPRAVSGKEEPFYFRAFSGECIEFLHTNETPHKLKLDDFQAKVPTDTIGQHIHLVKFDVTSSDGSGNGFNYEDGTFAPDELKERIHASGGEWDQELLSGDDKKRAAASLEEWRKHCEDAGELWTLRYNEYPACFQTTVQRWFVDPLLATTGETSANRAPVADRTLRTVFTHDHFAPSNIQQHGFYNALLIEPATKKATVYSGSRIGPAEEFGPVMQLEWDESGPALVDAKPLKNAQDSGDGVGVRARLENRPDDDNPEGAADPYHPDYREFALAIADFALLYDGYTTKNTAPKGEVGLDGSGGSSGLDRLILEARLNYPQQLEELNSKILDPKRRAKGICEHNRGRMPVNRKDDQPRPNGVDNSLPPAQAIACEIEEKRTSRVWLEAAAKQLIDNDFLVNRKENGWPVYPPKRPEAITQTHHDPYLLNYRTEPLPLRVGETKDGNDLLSGRECPDMTATTHAAEVRDSDVSISRQKAGDQGDMANVFRSMVHGDPCTPVFEAYSGERVMFRLIQGAQEVQHVFTVEGRVFRRNMDQAFASAARLDAASTKENGPTRWNACMAAAEAGLPWQQAQWFGTSGSGSPSIPWLNRYRTLVAECDNAAGLVTAQEIGISEHFEMVGEFSSDSGSNRGATFKEKISLKGINLQIENNNGMFSLSHSLDENSNRVSDQQFLLKSSELQTEILARDNAIQEVTALPVRDVLYHFGTVDALWNGAWGIMRSYNDKETGDVTRCLEEVSRVSEEISLRKDKLGYLQEKCGTQDKLSQVGGRLKPLADLLQEQSTAKDNSIPAIATPATMDTSATDHLGNLAEVDYPDLACPFLGETKLDVSGDLGTRAVGAYFKSPHVFVALVAIEARNVFKDETKGRLAYSADNAIYDPDALMLVPVPIEKLKKPGSDTRVLTREMILNAERKGFEADGHYPTLDWESVRSAAAEVVEASGGVPYVQRFNAGDCIHLVTINALTETKVEGARYGDMTGNHADGLRDLPGDALLPRITKLNTDQIKDGQSDAQDISIGEISGSASLALSIPLSKMTNVNDSPEPFGVNPRRALPPAENGKSVSYSVDVYFAGTVQFKTQELDNVLGNAGAGSTANQSASPSKCVVKRIYKNNPDQKDYHYKIWPSVKRTCETGSNREVKLNVLGRIYCGALEPVEADQTSKQSKVTYADVNEFQACVTDLISKNISDKQQKEPDIRLRVLPYAFGPLPVKSISDPISHGVHGLAGTIIVEPFSAEYPGRTQKTAVTNRCTAKAQEASDEGKYANKNWSIIESKSNQQSTVLTIPSIELCEVHKNPEEDNRPIYTGFEKRELPYAKVSETSLLWQDGLNLWDGYRRPFFSTESGGCQLVNDSSWSLNSPSKANNACMAESNRPGGPIPDCEICDDSYDRGEKGASYRTNALFARLRGQDTIPWTIGPQDWSSNCGWPVYYGSTKARESKGEGKCPTEREIDKTSNLNAWRLPPDLFRADIFANNVPLIEAHTDQEMLVRIVEPQGRARQRSFVLTGADYFDLFPGFGSGHSTLIAPGKAITAAISAPHIPGDYLWFDGPRQLMGGGTWGLMRIAPSSDSTPVPPENGN